MSSLCNASVILCYEGDGRHWFLVRDMCIEGFFEVCYCWKFGWLGSGLGGGVAVVKGMFSYCVLWCSVSCGRLGDWYCSCA